MNTVAFNLKFNQDFDAIYGETVEKLIEKHLLSRNEETIFMTRQGLMLGNDVFEAFLLDDIA